MKQVLIMFIVLLTGSCRTPKMTYVNLKSSKENDGLLGSTHAYLAEKIKNNTAYRDFAQLLDLDTFTVFIYSHNPEEYDYSQFMKGDSDSSVFSRLKLEYNADTSKLSDVSYDAESIFLMGRKRNGDCILIADTNNNNNFSDDSVYTFKKWFNNKEKIQNDNLPYVTLNNLKSNYNNKQVIFSEKVYIKPIKRDSTIRINGSLLPEMSMYLISSEYLIGRFRLKGKKYRIAVRNLNPKYLFDNNHTIVAFAKWKEDFAFSSTHDISSLYKIGEEIYLGEKAVEIKEIESSGKKIALKINANDKQSKIYDYGMKDFISKDTFSIQSLLTNHDFLLIDFWGSWCGPCIAAFPKLKELETSVKHTRIGFLGLIYDDSTNSTEIKALIAKFGLNWNQSLIDKNGINPIIDKNRVLSYPTFFLVNKNLKIIYRDFGLDGLERMKQKLAELKII